MDNQSEPKVMIKSTITRLLSRDLDGNPKYPGLQKLTWIKTPFMPWQLIEIAPDQA